MTTDQHKTVKPARARRRPGRPMQLRMVPMIDVVFLLLVFFMLTANFRSREGFLPAELPHRVTRAQLTEIEPLQLHLNTLPNGDCLVQIADQLSFVIPDKTNRPDSPGFQLLSDQLQKIIRQQRRHREDPVKIMPTRSTKWNHVVKAYDAAWQLDLTNIVFALAE